MLIPHQLAVNLGYARMRCNDSKGALIMFEGDLTFSSTILAPYYYRLVDNFGSFLMSLSQAAR